MSGVVVRGDGRAASAAPVDQADLDLVGATVAGLRVERVVAEGGVGAVYAARSSVSGRSFAVKVLKARHAGDAGLRGRFEREIRYAFRVAHPNVASALASGRLPDGRPFYVMDLLDGETLGARIRRDGPLDVATALALADQLLAGLAALHDQRIVHRDLQPDNVFLVRRPGGGVDLKIIDFGFAHEPGTDTGDGVTHDSPGSLVGTLTFMAPEQATRARAITERSDLFTAALLIHYALTGKIPFRGSHELDVLVSIVRSAPVPLRRERRDAPAALDRLLARALAKHPDARFPSAHEMRAALSKARA